MKLCVSAQIRESSVWKETQSSSILHPLLPHSADASSLKSSAHGSQVFP